MAPTHPDPTPPSRTHPTTPKPQYVPASPSCTHLGLPVAAGCSLLDGVRGRGCQQHTDRWSRMPAINLVTLMTLCLASHVHQGFIFSPWPRGMFGKHARLENHLADPKTSHSASAPPCPGIRPNRIGVLRGPLTLAVGAAAQSIWVPMHPPQSHAQG